MDAPQDLLHHLPVKTKLGIPYGHRIHMDHQLDPLLPKDVPFDVVNDLMAGQDALLRRHLGVDGGEAPPRAVAVDDQVVAVQNPVIGADKGGDLGHQLPVRGLPQKLVHGLADDVHPGAEDEQGHQDTHKAVWGEGQEGGRQGGKKDRPGSQHIGEAVGGGSLHKAGVDGPAQLPSKGAEPQLCQDGDGQHPYGHPGEGGGLRQEDPPHRVPGQLDAQQKDDDGDPHTGQVLVPGVAVGVICIGGAGCQAEAHQGDHRTPCVGEVVHPVGGDSHASRQSPCHQLPHGEEEVYQDPHHAPQPSVLPPDLGAVGVLPVLDEAADQKVAHGGGPPFLG